MSEREKAEELVKLVAAKLGVDFASLDAVLKASVVSDAEEWLRENTDLGYGW